MQSNDINYKIQKYTYKLKNAKSHRDIDLYQTKLQEYHKANRNMQGGEGESDQVKQQIKASQEALRSKLTETGKASVYEKEKVDLAMGELQKKIRTVGADFNELNNDKVALCNNTTNLMEGINKLKPGCAAEDFNIDTEVLLDDKKFIKSVCGQEKEQTTETEKPLVKIEKESEKEIIKSPSEQKGQGLFF